MRGRQEGEREKEEEMVARRTMERLTIQGRSGPNMRLSWKFEDFYCVRDGTLF